MKESVGDSTAAESLSFDDDDEKEDRSDAQMVRAGR
jgi:hypothetical protein